MSEPIVATPAEAAALPRGAAIVLDPLREYLDARGLGSGDVAATPIGDGHSNLTFLLERGGERLVIRRPPRGQLAASANDVLREAKILEALAGTAVPVPEVLARCEDLGVIGAPFFLMTFVPGATINDALPAMFDTPRAPRLIAEQTVATLVALHAIDLADTGLGDFGRPSGYLERQLRRFDALLEKNATRPLPELEAVAGWLGGNLPQGRRTTFVHGDYRLGNLLFGAADSVAAVLDWEMATVGDPLADLGYLTAMWAAPEDGDNPMFALSALTRRKEFPRREELAVAYEEASGEPIDGLRWYQVLALWKSAIFLEGSYRRYLEGAATDPYFGTLRDGVPRVAREALERSKPPGT